MLQRLATRLENNIIATEARMVADDDGVSCVFASLVEVGAIRSDRPVLDIRKIKDRLPPNKNGGIDVDKILVAARKGSELIGIPIVRIQLRDDFVKEVNIPAEMERMVEITQQPEPRLPSMVLLRTKGAEYDHVESLTSDRGVNRIYDKLIKGSWYLGVIEFARE